MPQFAIDWKKNCQNSVNIHVVSPLPSFNDSDDQGFLVLNLLAVENGSCKYIIVNFRDLDCHTRQITSYLVSLVKTSLYIPCYRCTTRHSSEVWRKFMVNFVIFVLQHHITQFQLILIYLHAWHFQEFNLLSYHYFVWHWKQESYM